MPKITVKNWTTYYELHGSAEESLVLISGLKGDHTGWTSVIEPLSRNYRVLIFDNRGVGQADSPAEEYTVEQMADDTIHLIRALGIKNPIIIGHSLGGAIAQTLALQFPTEIKALVLCNTFPKLNPQSIALFESVYPLFSTKAKPSEILKVFLKDVFSKAFLSQPGIEQFILDTVDADPFPQSEGGYKGQMQALKQFDSKTWLNQLQLPVLIIHASEDSIVSWGNAQDLSRALPQSNLKIFSGGHATHVEQTTLFLDSLNAFLTTLNEEKCHVSIKC